jgi:hypothetical protein
MEVSASHSPSLGPLLTPKPFLPRVFCPLSMIPLSGKESDLLQDLLYIFGPYSLSLCLAVCLFPDHFLNRLWLCVTSFEFLAWDLAPSLQAVNACAVQV